MAPGVPAQLQAAAAAAQLQQQAHQTQPTSNTQQPQTPQLTAPTGNPYPGYNLASVDMSGFQNAIDWSSMYGMNMYV